VAGRIASAELLIRELRPELSDHGIDGFEPLVAGRQLDDLH
jgi:hypothetical protein